MCTCKLSASKTRMSPVLVDLGLPKLTFPDVFDGEVENGDMGEGVGEGYKRKQFSLEGANAMTAIVRISKNFTHVHTIRVRARFNGMNELHVAYIVNVNLLLQQDDQSAAVEFNSKNGGLKREFTNSSISLPK